MKVKSAKSPLIRLMKLVPSQPLRRWELRLNEALLERDGVRRFCATVIAEALLDIYRRKSARHAQEALVWLSGSDALLPFKMLCEQFDIEPARLRNDVLDDVRCGRTKLGGKLHVEG